MALADALLTVLFSNTFNPRSSSTPSSSQMASPVDRELCLRAQRSFRYNLYCVKKPPARFHLLEKNCCMMEYITNMVKLGAELKNVAVRKTKVVHQKEEGENFGIVTISLG